MQENDHANIIELIPAFALGSLDAEEMGQVEQHLQACDVCLDELTAYQGVTDLLSLAAPDAAPPPQLKTRLMARAAGLSAASPRELSRPQPRSPQRRLSWAQQLGAALQRLFAGPAWQPLALLLIVALGISNILLWQKANPPEPTFARRFRLSGTEATPSASGIIYISQNGRNGALIVEGLPALGPDEQYQLWLIRDGQRDSGAVFSVTEDGYRSQQISSPLPLKDYSAFGITIEPTGGSPGPTGQRVLGFNL